MINFLTAVWTDLKKAWIWFEAQVAKVMPGFKTHIVTALGAIGSGAASLQEYFTGLPLNKLMNDTQALALTCVLFTLAFWFHNMSPRNHVDTN